jgi:hypothetical protein
MFRVRANLLKQLLVSDSVIALRLESSFSSSESWNVVDIISFLVRDLLLPVSRCVYSFQARQANDCEVPQKRALSTFRLCLYIVIHNHSSINTIAWAPSTA